MMLLDVTQEIVIYLGIVVFGVPMMLFGLFRCWQVCRPVKQFRRMRRR